MSSRYRLGLDLGGSQLTAVALDSDQQVCAERQVDAPRDDYHGLLSSLGAVVLALESELGAEGLPVGLGTACGVDPLTGGMRKSSRADLSETDLVRDLSTALGRDIRAARRAECMALSESVDGAGQGLASVFALTLGSGVGGGWAINERLVTGCNGIAGEWGHNNLPWPSASEIRQSPACWCGQQGCIDAWLSAPGMSADHVRRGGHTLSAREIIARAEGGERLAGATLRDWLSRLARALAMVVNLLDPHVIVCGGGLAEIRWLYSEIPKIWGQHILAPTIQTRLLPATDSAASCARGAARLWPIGG